MTLRPWTKVLLAVAILAAPTTVCAQGSSSQANVPMIASGQMPTAVPSGDLSPTNVFNLNVSAGVRFDDNALFSSVPRHSDLYYSFTPNLAFDQTLRRVSWGVSYGPGVDISQHAFYPDQFTNDVGGHFTWLVSKHSSFSAQQNYIRSTDPFQQFGSQPYTTTPGPLVAPNQSIFVPNLHREGLLSQAQYSYQLSAHTSMGLGGSFGLEHYNYRSGNAASTPLINSQAVSGQAYISHQISPRHQLGVEYNAEVFKFSEFNARSTIHSFLVFDDLRLTAKSKLSLYGGPEYALTSNQVELGLGFVILQIPVQSNEWTWSAGGAYSWTGHRAAMVLNYSRRVSTGMGLVGAVQLDGGSADFTWKATKNWSVRLGLAAADNQLLAIKSSQDELLTYSASLGLSRQLFRNMFMNFGFQRVNQTGSLRGLSTGNHDIAYVSLEYRFAKPLGR